MNRADCRPTASASGKHLFQRRDNYDANGSLAGIDDSRKGNRSYHYDPLDRLISVRGAMPESFARDPAGNLLGQNDLPAANLANVKGNRLLMQGDRHYDYDAYGNLTRERRGTGQRLVTEYHYDCQHRLIGVSLPGGSTASYKYDAFGRRIEKTVDGQTTEFLWQGERLIAESAESRYRTYIYELGSFRPLAMLDGEGPLKATPFYYQLDHLGTPQELTDFSGEIMWSAKYRAYGNLAALDVAEIDNPLRFQGQYFDAETGLHYNRHRYYNPSTARYLTPDPIKLAGGLNNYQYVPNPTGWVDPLGLMCGKGDCPDVSPPLTQSQIDEIIATPKGMRPDPSSYLSADYISNHLSQFDGGATRFMTQNNLDRYGIGQRDGTSFVMPRSEADRLLASANGDSSVLESSLGLEPGFLSNNQLLRVDITNPRELGLRIPSGNEAGANDLWIPGGKLPNGNSEAIVDAKGPIAPKLEISPLSL